MIALVAALLASSVPAPSTCRDGLTADDTVTSVYDLVSVPPGGGWDWDRIGALFVDPGLFVTMLPREGGTLMAKTDLETLCTETEAAYTRSGFIEAEYRRETRIFGGIASIYSSFFIALPSARNSPLATGLHHFQLAKISGCWRIVSNISQIEGGGWTLPKTFRE